jgi:hypothetical protein
MRTGSVVLPLHPGKCPPWLFRRMKPLSKAISQLIIDEYGTMELLKRLSDPMFFQSFCCAIAFDWHSSGTTTTACGALKEALAPDMGIVACGGKGKASRKIPAEIANHSNEFGLSDSKRSALLEATRLSAKVDSSCVQDGYDLYHHSFFMDEKGNWAVVQQGLNDASGYARRYHWLATENFVDGPPENIAGMKKEDGVLNLVSPETNNARERSVELVQDNPLRLQKYFTGQTTLFDSGFFRLPERHEILKCDLSKKDWEMLERAYEIQPKNYEELVSLNGMGKKKLRALALVSKLIYGTGLDWKDPVKYSFAHGGKDGYPFPVDRESYDNTIRFLRDAVDGAKLEAKEKNAAMVRLASLA